MTDPVLDSSANSCVPTFPGSAGNPGGIYVAALVVDGSSGTAPQAPPFFQSLRFLSSWRVGRLQALATIAISAGFVACGGGHDAPSNAARAFAAPQPAVAAALCEGVVAPGSTRGFAIVGGQCVATFAPMAAQARLTPLRATVDNASLLAWAEGRYPDYFKGATTDGEYAGYTYRFYQATGNYIGFSNGNVYVLGPVSGGELLLVGSSASFACQVLANCPLVNKIENFVVTPQSDGVLYYTGTYQGKTVRFTHEGDIGKGRWFLYSGTPGDRTRITVSDTGGMTELLAMDKGYRTTVNYVATERIEYRNYSPDSKFKYGAVLYPSGGRWLLGLMTSEAFTGYGQLVTLTDVTARIDAGRAELSNLIAKTEQKTIHRLSFISTAYAQDIDLGPRVIGGVLFDSFAQAAEIALTVVPTLAVVTLETIEAGSGISTVAGGVVVLTEGAAAVLTAPVAGVFIGGVVVAKVAEYFVATVISPRRGDLEIATGPLSNNSDEYRSLTTPTPYSTTPAPVPPAPQAASVPATAPVVVTSVEPRSAIVGQQTNFIVRGGNLTTNGLLVLLKDCPYMVGAGGTASSMTFVCTPSSTGTKTGSVTDARLLENLFTFSVEIAAAPIPSSTITSITPTTATLNQSTTYRVAGTDLRDGMSFALQGCSGTEVLGVGTSTMRQFTCTSTLSGPNIGEIKDKLEGLILKTFTVNVAAAQVALTCFQTPELKYCINDHGNYQGEVTTYRGDGRVESITMFEDGIPNGPFSGYFANGILAIEGTYKNGYNYDGIVRVYRDPTGQLLTNSVYSNGTPLLQRQYDASGAIALERTFVNGVRSEVTSFCGPGTLFAGQAQSTTNYGTSPSTTTVNHWSCDYP